MSKRIKMNGSEPMDMWKTTGLVTDRSNSKLCAYVCYSDNQNRWFVELYFKTSDGLKSFWI
jgi:hypothetical protein